MSAKNRPISPHLQVYRLPVTGLISITHRITGVLLSLGLILFVLLLLVLVKGEASYHNMQLIMTFWLCRLLFWGIIFSLFVHLCHGIRHLLWDAGKTLQREVLNQFALLEIAVSVALTVLTFLSF